MTSTNVPGRGWRIRTRALARVAAVASASVIGWGAAGAGLAVAAGGAEAQARGAVGLDAALRRFTSTARVLVIAAHPDDEDTQAIAWLARGRNVETAYLSLTRGDGGQNLIGNELGEALGAIRTEELLAARRIDGGRQYFTRAFDFGFSKNAEETEKHWPRDTILADVVTVIRAFRPHVVYSIWSGTRADGHGHHEFAGIVAREAYDVAGDTVRFSPSRYGEPWEPMKFYRRGAALALDVNEYDPVLGRTYASIAAESRSQHRSQGFAGVALRSIVPGAGGGRGRGGGPGGGSLEREATRVNADVAPGAERSIFDGVDTTFARHQAAAGPRWRVTLASIAALADSAATALDLADPAPIVPFVARMSAAIRASRVQLGACRSRAALPRAAPDAPAAPGRTRCSAAELDLDAALETLERRVQKAVVAAAQIEIDAIAPRELLAFGDSVPVTVAVVNHGKAPITVSGLRITGGPRDGFTDVVLPPDSGAAFTQSVIGYPDHRSWWTGGERADGYFNFRRSPFDGVARVSSDRNLLVPAVAVSEERRRMSDVWLTFELAGETVLVNAGPLVYRAADPLLGVQDHPMGGVPPVTFSFDGILEWIPAGKPVDRLMRLTVRSYSDAPRTLALKSVVPAGLRLDSLPASITIGPRERREVLLRLRGRLTAGRHPFGVYGEDSTGARLTDGFFTINYPHTRPIHVYRSSALWIQAVNITVPAGLKVAYIQGVGDASPGYLRQLEFPVTVIRPADLAQWDLSTFTTVVVGTVVMQYSQSLGAIPQALPYPMTWQQRAERVTVEEAPVTVLDPRAKVLNFPNLIGPNDWLDWVQERSLYMPSTIDSRYRTPLEMHDPDEPENRGAIVTASVGRGMFVFTSLALFRQIPAAVPGSARLFVNLLSAGMPAPAPRSVP